MSGSGAKRFDLFSHLRGGVLKVTLHPTAPLASDKSDTSERFDTFGTLETSDTSARSQSCALS
jgi:hypothetical protein